MEKQRSIKILSVVALIVAVLGLTIAFAALSTSLEITGTGSVKGNTSGGTTTWDIHFDHQRTQVEVSGSNLNADTLESYLSVDDTTHSIDISTTPIPMVAPGDVATYSFVIVNNGSQAAKLSSLDLKDEVCSGTNSDDENKVCGANFIYDLEITNDKDKFVEGDILYAGQELEVRLTIGYSKEATELPTNDVSITNLGVDFEFVQYLPTTEQE